jgi:prepilin-type N-terminal cleavage/methylation domain-containing protein
MRRNRGFTLLEVLLAVGIVVLVTAVMAETLRVNFGLKKAAENAIDSIRDMNSVGDIWVNDVRNCVPPNPNSSVDPNSINNTTTGSTSSTGTTTGTVSMGGTNFIFGAFYGDNTTLDIYSTGTDKTALVQCGVRYVAYSLAPQPDGTLALVRQIETNLLSDTDPTQFPSGSLPEVLVSNVLSVKFSYYDGTTWNDTWDSTQLSNSIPYSVEMELTLTGAHPGDPQRVIRRFASVSCAAPVVDTTSTTGGVTGIGGTP